jgi:hypothetical protein
MPANPNPAASVPPGRAVARRAGALVGLGGDSRRRLYLRIATEGDTTAHRTLRRHVGRQRRHLLHRNAFTLLTVAYAVAAVRRLRGLSRILALLAATAAAGGAARTHRQVGGAETRYGSLLDAIDRAQHRNRHHPADGTSGAD